jgi:hypothetical protein
LLSHLWEQVNRWGIPRVLFLGVFLLERLGGDGLYYLAAIMNVILSASAIWGLPADGRVREGEVWKRLRSEIDWVGAVIGTVSTSLVSYVLA